MRNVVLLMFCCLVAMPSYARVKCSQFATQAEAQAYMQQHGARYLDRDHDGIACEHLAGGKQKAAKSSKRRASKSARSGVVRTVNNPMGR